MSFFISFLMWASSAFLAAFVADEKGHDWLKWGVAGILFGPLGLLAAVGLSDAKLRRSLKNLSEQKVD